MTDEEEEALRYNNERLGLAAAALALLASFLWGGNQPFIKLGLDGLPPLAMGAARIGIGWLIMAGAARWRRVPLAPTRGEWRGLCGLGGLLFLQIFLLNAGTNLTLATRSSIIIAAHPFFIVALCHVFVPGDRLTWSKVVGCTLAFGGVSLIFADFDNSASWPDSLMASEYILGDIIVLCSAVLLGARLVVTKRLVAGLEPVKLMFWQLSVATPLFVVASAIFESDSTYQFNTQVIGAILYQGVVVAGFCFLVWIHLLKRYSASRLSAFSFTTPVLGVALSVLLVGDALSAELLVSAALVGLGIIIVERG